MCVDKFRTGPDGTSNMTEFKKVSTWQQDSFIQKGGWATFPGMGSPDLPSPAPVPTCSERRRRGGLRTST